MADAKQIKVTDFNHFKYFSSGERKNKSVSAPPASLCIKYPPRFSLVNVFEVWFGVFSQKL